MKLISHAHSIARAQPNIEYEIDEHTQLVSSITSSIAITNTQSVDSWLFFFGLFFFGLLSRIRSSS